MSGITIRSPYAVPCRTHKRDSDSIIYAASSLPGSRTLRYIPREPRLHNYGIAATICANTFRVPWVWRGESNITPQFRYLSQKLKALPVEEGSFVTYMRDAKGFFFDLELKEGIRMTLSQYEDEFEQGAYVNVMLHGDVVIQDYMSIDDIVSSMLTYYNGTK